MKRALIVAWLTAGCVGSPGAAQQSLMQGDMLLVRKEYEGAAAQYSQAIANDPYLREAHLHRGIALRCLGEHERALADLDRAIQLDPTFGRAYTERARAKLGLIAARANGDKAKLSEAFGPNDPLGLNPDLGRAVNFDGLSGDGTALLVRGAVRLMQQRDAEAQQDFDHYLRRRPKAQPQLDAAVTKWKQERPVLDLSPVEELSKLAPRRS
jgi:tetratricopeptide (TPR) repeat protein